MTTPRKDDGVQLTGQDRARLDELRREARARLEEMAEIMARALRIDRHELVEMTLRCPGSGGRYEKWCGRLTGGCVCWEDPPGVCRPCGPDD